MESTVPARKRLTISLAPADHEWLEAQAADEGVDAVTLLGMLVTRLRQNRPALYRQALERAIAPTTTAAAWPSTWPAEALRLGIGERPPGRFPKSDQPRDIADGPLEIEVANAAELAATVADLEHEYPENGVAAETEHDAKQYPQDANASAAAPEPAVAFPLFTPERPRFNPGRQ